MGKGANFTPTEDLELCRAFVSASEDATVGTDQNAAEFKVKMQENYVRLLDALNKKNATRYPYRMGHSNFARFKKISKLLLKYIGIEEAAGDPPSGDNDRIEWDNNCKEAFIEQNPDGKNVLDNVLFCKEFLQSCPKWRPFEENNATVGANIKRKKERPVGSKKAKQLKADIDLVKNLSGLSKEQVSNKEDSLVKHQAAQRQFMNQVGSGMAAFAQVLSEQNDAKLLECMMPSSRNKMAQEMLRMKMKARFGPVVTTTETVSTPPASTGNTTSVARAKGKVIVLPSDTDDVAGDSDASSEEEEDVDDSPGDNRKRSPGGTLRLPAHLVRKYAAANAQGKSSSSEDSNDDENNEGGYI
jgi:hypothetical protein